MHLVEFKVINYMYKTNKKNKLISGYTIIETMIAVSVFLVVIMSGMGALLNANGLYKKSQNMRSIMDNMSFIMEDMSRNLRTGSNYQCFEIDDVLSPSTIGSPRSCVSGWAIAFEAPLGNTFSYADQWVYYIAVTPNPDGTSTGKIFKSTDGANNFEQITPNEVVMDPISGFSVLGGPMYYPSEEDRQQPLIGINLIGSIIYKSVVTPFSLQTSVSSRLVDI